VGVHGYTKLPLGLLLALTPPGLLQNKDRSFVPDPGLQCWVVVLEYMEVRPCAHTVLLQKFLRSKSFTGKRSRFP
jgi:hypothetical protein